VNVEGDCILWTGRTAGRPGYEYGTTYVPKTATLPGHTTTAHRAAYEAAHGPVPDGMQVEHRCRERLCIRLDHLEAVTPSENQRRGSLARYGAVKLDTHGTTSCYVNSGCRCDACRDAWNTYYRKRWAENRAAGLDPKRPRKSAAA